MRIIPAVETVPAAAEGGVAGLIAKLEALVKTNARRKTDVHLKKTVTEDMERLKNEGSFPASDRYILLYTVWQRRLTI